MPRQTARLLLRAAPLLAVLLGISIAADLPRPAAASGALSLAVTLTPAEPRCNGGAVLMTLRATNPDGSAASRVPVHVLLPNGGEPSSVVTRRTNSGGVAHVVVRPQAGLHDRFFYVATVDGGAGPRLSVGPCPLSDAKDYFITGTMFLDTGTTSGDGSGDGDDGQDAGGRAVRGQAISLEGGCAAIACWLPPHTVRTDARGNFGWTGLTQVDPTSLPTPAFTMCLPDGRSNDRRIVSVNGAPVTPGACANVGTLHPGENVMAIGVR